MYIGAKNFWEEICTHKHKGSTCWCHVAISHLERGLTNCLNLSLKSNILHMFAFSRCWRSFGSRLDFRRHRETRLTYECQLKNKYTHVVPYIYKLYWYLYIYRNINIHTFQYVQLIAKKWAKMRRLPSCSPQSNSHEWLHKTASQNRFIWTWTTMCHIFPTNSCAATLCCQICMYVYIYLSTLSSSIWVRMLYWNGARNIQAKQIPIPAGWWLEATSMFRWWIPSHHPKAYIKLDGGMALLDTLHIITVITAHPIQCNFNFKFQFNLRWL